MVSHEREGLCVRIVAQRELDTIVVYSFSGY